MEAKDIEAKYVNSLGYHTDGDLVLDTGLHIAGFPLYANITIYTTRLESIQAGPSVITKSNLNSYADIVG